MSVLICLILLLFGFCPVQAGETEILIRSQVLDYEGQKLEIEDFYLDRTEVSLGAYQTVAAYEGLPPSRFEHHPGWDRPELPVTGIDWHSARRYCQSKGRRLPRVQEYLAAWQGDLRTIFPFGDDLPTKAPFHLPGSAPMTPYPTDSFENLASDDGVLNLAGNVAEWTAEGPLEDSRFRYVFGGSFADDLESVRWGHFLKTMPASEGESPSVGFRCARDGRIRDAIVLTERRLEEEAARLGEEARLQAEEQRRKEEANRLKWLKIFSFEEMERRQAIARTLVTTEGRLVFPPSVHISAEDSFVMTSFAIDLNPSSEALNWQEAQNACTARGGRLPTEWEWEKALAHRSLPETLEIPVSGLTGETGFVAGFSEWMIHSYVSRAKSLKNHVPYDPSVEAPVFPALRSRPPRYETTWMADRRHGALPISQNFYRCVYPGTIHPDFEISVQDWPWRGEEFFARLKKRIEAGEDVFDMDWRSLEFERRILRREGHQGP